MCWGWGRPSPPWLSITWCRRCVRAGNAALCPGLTAAPQGIDMGDGSLLYQGGIDTRATKEMGSQTETHPIPSFIDKNYEWNEWALRRRALMLVRTCYRYARPARGISPRRSCPDQPAHQADALDADCGQPLPPRQLDAALPREGQRCANSEGQGHCAAH